MTWVANLLLILAYCFIRPRPRLGWVLSLIGNGLWMVMAVIGHRGYDLLALSSVFTILATYNLVKVSHEKSIEEEGTEGGPYNRHPKYPPGGNS